MLLRPVPGRTVIHDLWAGTKLIVVAGIGVLLTFYPGWVPIGVVAALILVDGVAGANSARRIALDTALVVGTADSRRRHRGLGRRQPGH